MGAFGDRLRELRVCSGLTQSEVAKSVGISGAYLSLLETGERTPPPRALVETLATTLAADATALWYLARTEREGHLLERIDGVPTTLRTASKPSTESSATYEALAQIAEDPELAVRLHALYAALPDKAARRELLADLDRWIANLDNASGEL